MLRVLVPGTGPGRDGGTPTATASPRSSTTPPRWSVHTRALNELSPSFTVPEEGPYNNTMLNGRLNHKYYVKLGTKIFQLGEGGPSPGTEKLREGYLTALVLTRPAHLSRTRTFIRNKSRGQSASFKSLSRSSRQHHGHSRPASIASAALLSGQTRKVNINTHITAFSHLLSL